MTSACSIARTSLGFGCQKCTEVPGGTRFVSVSFASTILAVCAYRGANVVTIFNALPSADGVGDVGLDDVAPVEMLMTSLSTEICWVVHQANISIPVLINVIFIRDDFFIPQ